MRAIITFSVVFEVAKAGMLQNEHDTLQTDHGGIHLFMYNTHNLAPENLNLGFNRQTVAVFNEASLNVEEVCKIIIKLYLH